MSSKTRTQRHPAYGKLLLAMSIEPEEVGQRIKAARERRNLTQMEFALLANVSVSSVQRWEAGKLPPVRELLRIAVLLDVEAEQFVEIAPEVEAATREDAAAIHEDIQGLRRILSDPARLATVDESWRDELRERFDAQDEMLRSIMRGVEQALQRRG